jgi:uncharacterized protein (DUF885 family)
VLPIATKTTSEELAPEASQATAHIPNLPKPKPTLSQMLRDHTEAADKQRKQTDQKRKEVLESVTKVTDSMVDSVNRGVARVFANQKKIEQETKQLEMNATKFNKQAQQWNLMVANLGNALKEIGDVENWASVIEADLIEISRALEFLHAPTSS